MTKNEYAHFEGKSPLNHVKEKRAVESHGREMPGAYSAAADAAREMAICLMILWTIVPDLRFTLFFIPGYLIWKVARSAWLGWSRLERLHRVIEEERYEIEHHRPQERDELVALYSEKGFEGKLLEEVVDVLMADSDRLLKVMLEEEMGLTLEVHEHPLKLCLGAGIGALVAAVAFVLSAFSLYGPIVAALAVVGFSGAFTARLEKSRLVPATVWNVAIGGIVFGFTYFLIALVL